MVNFYCMSIPLRFLRPSGVSKVDFLASIRTKHEMSRTRDSATPSPEHEPIFEETEPEDITREQFNDDIGKGLAEMITQYQFNKEEGEEGRAGEAAGGDDEEDDDEDEEEGYESLEDPFPPKARRRPTEEEPNKDFDPNEEVGIKP
jgi:hypothetical protein